ncbi:Nuclear receptor 2C2-associated protein [Lemmus lemmus]
MSQSLVCPETVSRVSSVLNRNSRQFGKKYLFDEDEETCWNSDQVRRFHVPPSQV